MDLPLRLSAALAVGLALAGGPPPLELYVAANHLYALYKPAAWKVTEEPGADSFAVTVAPADASAEVHLFWGRASGAQASALACLKQVRDSERRRHPGVSFGDLLVARNGLRAAVTTRFPRSGIPYQSRIFVETDGRKWSLQSYCARASELPAQRPLLMNVMMSVALVKQPRGAGGAGPEPVREPLVERRAADGSLRMRVPQGWGFLAAKGMVVTSEPGGGAGFIFTSFAGNPMLPGASVPQGVIGRRYLPPAQALPVILAGFGHHDPQVLSATPDPATVAQYRAVVGRGCEAADLVAAWTARGGPACLGAFKVVNGLPQVMGQWTSIVAGVWGPRAGFGRYLPLLEEVAGSCGINDQYARQYIQSGLANLRRLQQQTAGAVQGLNQAREDQQKAWEDRQARKDYLESRWDDYRRGDSYWVSDLEGGKVYHTDPQGTLDTRTGDYYEGGGYTWTRFEGRNPNHPSEDMREVSSYELEHGAPPP